MDGLAAEPIGVRFRGKRRKGMEWKGKPVEGGVEGCVIRRALLCSVFEAR